MAVCGCMYIIEGGCMHMAKCGCMHMAKCGCMNTVDDGYMHLAAGIHCTMPTPTLVKYIWSAASACCFSSAQARKASSDTMSLSYSCCSTWRGTQEGQGRAADSGQHHDTGSIMIQAAS